MIFLAEFGQRLTVLHTLAAMVLLGAVSHQAVVAYRAWRGRWNARLGRIYALTGLVAGALTVALGAVTYPAYRYYVRGLYLDHCAVATSKLFDVKEDFAAFALLLAAAVWAIARDLERQSPRVYVQVYAGASFLLAGLVWFNALSGLLITLVRGMP